MSGRTLVEGIELCVEIAERKHPEDFKLHGGDAELIRALRIETFVAGLAGILQCEDMDKTLSNRVFALLADAHKAIKKDLLIVEGAKSIPSMRSTNLTEVIVEETGIAVALRQPRDQEVTQHAGLVDIEIKGEPTNTRVAQPDTDATTAQQPRTHVGVGNDTDIGGGSSG